MRAVSRSTLVLGASTAVILLNSWIIYTSVSLPVPAQPTSVTERSFESSPVSFCSHAWIAHCFVSAQLARPFQLTWYFQVYRGTTVANNRARKDASSGASKRAGACVSQFQFAQNHAHNLVRVLPLLAHMWFKIQPGTRMQHDCQRIARLSSCSELVQKTSWCSILFFFASLTLSDRSRTQMILQLRSIIPHQHST